MIKTDFLSVKNNLNKYIVKSVAMAMSNKILLRRTQLKLSGKKKE